MKTNVDVLTLTATPIPTLHNEYWCTCDLSVIETPPETASLYKPVLEQNSNFIKEALERELSRDGQVYSTLTIKYTSIYEKREHVDARSKHCCCSWTDDRARFGRNHVEFYNGS